MIALLDRLDGFALRFACFTVFRRVMVGVSVYRGVRLKDAFKQDIDAAVMKAEQTGKQNDRLNRLRQARDHEFLRFPPPSARARDEVGRTNTRQK